ncbi:MAG: hypothetical protein H6977_03890 [Gammaproteobacteria bacterium]|nr:hypothetical protein [Gammaproteobacteria bacterium]
MTPSRPSRYGLLTLLVLLCGLATLAVDAAAKDKGKGNDQGPPAAAGGKSHAHDAGHGKTAGAEPRAAGGPGRGAAVDGGDYWRRDWDAADFLAAGFSAAVLHELVGERPALLEQGARPLPPGIAKNLARGKPLPPGIAQQRVGADLGAVLPRVAEHEWRRVGTDLVLVQAGTAIVAEIIRNVLR